MNKRSVGIALSYVNSFLNLVTGLFLSSFLLRQTGAVDYGIYQTVSSFVNYLVLLEFGTGTVMIRNISVCRSRNASKEEIHRNISTVWSICIMLSALIVAVSVVFYCFFDVVYANSLTHKQIIYGKNIFIFATINLVVSFIWQTLKSVTLAFEDYAFSSKQSIVKIIIRTTVLLLAVSFVKKAIVIAAVDALLGIVIAVYTYIHCVRKFRIKIGFSGFDKLILKAALPLCLAVFLQAILTQANNNVAKFIIGVKMLPEIVSLYSVALYIESMFNMLTSLPIGMYAPQTAKVMNKAEGDYKKITDYLALSGRLISIVGGTVTFGFIAAGKPFVTILYGKEYSLAYMIAVILMLPALLYKLTAPAMNVLDVLNKRMSRSLILAVTAILNIALTIWWIDLYGIVGAAVATSVSAFVGQFVVMNIYYSRVIGIKVMYLYKKSFSGILVYQILGAGLGYFVSSSIKNNYASFLLGGIVYIVVSFGGYILFGLNEDEDKKKKAFINKFLRKIHSK